MKGVVAIAAISIAAILACSTVVMANPPIIEPVQYEQYCESQKVTGTGVIDVSTSIVDKRLALEYYNVLAGDGDFELDSEHALSENASKLMREVGNKTMPVNLFENTKMTYSGDVPLVGGKFLNSKSFYGGIGANFQEVLSVTQMEKDQQTFFASTDPAGHTKNATLAAQLRNMSPVHLVGMNTKNTFEGTWGTDSAWHKIFYKDIKDHQQFTGNFETEKLIKFHENPVPEPVRSPCAGIDC